MKRSKGRARWLIAFAVLTPTRSEATWSITAVDPHTRQVGIALASCVGGVDISATGGLIPGLGVIAAQANTNPEARRVGMELLSSGATPTAVLNHITAEGFDPQPFLSWTSGRETRQCAVVALEGTPATFTGSRTMGWAGSVHGFGVSVQGNMLRGPRVAEAALAAYERASACSLPDRLMLALEAGGAAGGDRRCSAEIPALSGYLEVAWPTDRPGQSSLRLVANDPRDTAGVWRFFKQLLRPEKGDPNENPLRSLRGQLTTWRRQHPGELVPCRVNPRDSP